MSKTGFLKNIQMQILYCTNICVSNVFFRYISKSYLRTSSKYVSTTYHISYTTWSRCNETFFTTYFGMFFYFILKYLIFFVGGKSMYNKKFQQSSSKSPHTLFYNSNKNVTKQSQMRVPCFFSCLFNRLQSHRQLICSQTRASILQVV